jgi:nitroimidazol reductase NimA-like FMN-containing flavoprotein (pyridoxamine 5'-phosphate oxidase superfamily)
VTHRYDDVAQIDRNGLEVLGREECLQLLATVTIGRVGISLGALPTILPVNFRLVGEEVAFRTAMGTKLDAATRNAVVAFEVDDLDPIYHSGWSVVIIGVAREVTDAAELARFERARIPRWAPVGSERVIAISTQTVSGRRIAARTTRRRAE